MDEGQGWAQTRHVFVVYDVRCMMLLGCRVAELMILLVCASLELHVWCIVMDDLFVDCVLFFVVLSGVDVYA